MANPRVRGRSGWRQDDNGLRRSGLPEGNVPPRCKTAYESATLRHHGLAAVRKGCRFESRVVTDSLVFCWAAAEIRLPGQVRRGWEGPTTSRSVFSGWTPLTNGM
jgi:hypothetical protein